MSIDGDGDGGVIIGARLLDVGAGAAEASLVLTRLASTAGRGPATSDGAAASGRRCASVVSRRRPPDDSTPSAHRFAFAYLGQPYVVAPDGASSSP